MADLWQGVGTRGGVVERSAATDGSWDYLPNQGGGVQPAGTYRGGGIQLNGPSTSGDIIEYQSCELPGTTIAPQARTFPYPPYTGPVGSGLLDFLVNVDFASNIAIGLVNAVMGKFLWRIGFTKSARLTSPPQGIYFEKTAGITAADATWYIVARDGSGEQREPVQYVVPGLNQLSIRSFGIFNAFNRIMTKGFLTTQYLENHIPTDGMNIFMQIIPSDAAVDSHLQVYNYGYGGQLYNSTTKKFPGWYNTSIGKLGWTCAALDYYGFAVFGDPLDPGISSGASVRPFRLGDSGPNHPGVLTLTAGPSNVYKFTPDGMGGGIPAESTTTTSLVAPYGSPEGAQQVVVTQFSLTSGHWLARFIVHLGEGDNQWNPSTCGYEAAIGLLTGTLPYGPTLQKPTCGFYIKSIDSDASPTGNWRFYNAFSPIPEDIDTGILAADPAGLQTARWLMLEIEKMPNRNQIIGRIYSANRDGKDRTLWEHTGGYDGGTWDGNILGPLYEVFYGPTGGADGAKMQIDAYGIKMNLAQTAA